MSGDINSYIGRLQALLEQKKEALEAINKLTMAQQADIEKNQGENLSNFIDEKQLEIEKIQVIDEDFENTFEIFKSQLKIKTLDDIDIKDYPQFRDVKKVISEIMDLAKNIMELELKNKDRVSDIIEDLKKELKTVRLGQKSIKAYEKPNINIGGVYIDRKK